MTGHHRLHRSSAHPACDLLGLSRHHLLLALLVAVVSIALAVALEGCGKPALGSDDQEATARVLAYFAGEGAGFVTGISVRDVNVKTTSQGRVLSVTFVRPATGETDGSFSSLYYGSVGDSGWTAALNKLGLNLTSVSMEFDYGDGLPDRLEVNIARQSIAGSTRLRQGPSTTSR
jgi:hypothetical protein